MSNTEFVMVPREFLEYVAEYGDKQSRYEAEDLLSQPDQQHQGDPVALPERKTVTAGLLSESNTHNHGWNACLDEIAKLGTLYTQADPGEVERLRAELAETQRISHEEELRANRYSAQLAEAQALLRELLEYAELGWDFIPDISVKVREHLSAVAEPSATECKGWTCFHCDEHFKDAKSAEIHFGAHEIQRPACLIDAAEYRSMEARVRECANEDSDLHRQIHHLANEHKLEIRRAEESGYAKGVADASAPVEIDERAEFEKSCVDRARRSGHPHEPHYLNRAWQSEDYVNPQAQAGWLSCQARAALERKS